MTTPPTSGYGMPDDAAWRPPTDPQAQPQPQPPAYGQQIQQPPPAPAYGAPMGAPAAGATQQMPAAVPQPQQWSAPGQHAVSPEVVLPYATSEPKKSKAPLVIAGVAVFALLIAGVAFAANRFMGKIEIAAQKVLPASTIGVLSFTMDPENDQKVNALRFARKFSSAREVFSSDSQDLDVKKAIWDRLAKDEQGMADVNYDQEIGSWAGNRITIALVPGIAPKNTEPEPIPSVAASPQYPQQSPPATTAAASGQPALSPVALKKAADSDEPEPSVVFVVEAKDIERARQEITKINERENDDVGVAYAQDQVIFAETQEEADKVVSGGQQSALDSNDNFTKDLKNLGELGVIFGWLDMGKLKDTLPEETEALFPSYMFGGVAGLGQEMTGRYTFATRFVDDDLETVMRAEGFPKNQTMSSDNTVDMGNLPEDTLGSLSTVDLGQSLVSQWTSMKDVWKKYDDSIDSEIAKLETKYNIKLPEELKVLFGEQFTMAWGQPAPGNTNEQLYDSGNNKTPQAGIRVTTDADRFEQILNSISQAETQKPLAENNVFIEKNDKTVAVGSSSDYAKKLSEGGNLGESEQFQNALPDAEKASVAMFVDVDGLKRAFPEISETSNDAAEIMGVIDAVGFTIVPDGDNAAEAKFRIVTN